MGEPPPSPNYHASVGLSLVVGPAHAGKVALLYERYLQLLDRDPWLIVPNQADVEVVERELVTRSGGLLAGTVGTFDRLFEALATGDGRGRRPIGETARALLVRRAIAAGDPDAPWTSLRFPGYADSLAGTLAELEGGLLDPEMLAGPLATLVREYRALLDGQARWDRGALRRRAIDRLTGDLDAWAGSPVLAYGFEDLTMAEWRLLEALAARTDVHVSLPYEPGRAAYASLSRTAGDLAALAEGAVVELPAAASQHLPTSIAHIERHLFADDPVRGALDGSVRFLEAAGLRATLELVAEEALTLIRSGVAPEKISVICPSLDAIRATAHTAFEALGVPIAVEGVEPFRGTPFGQSLLALLRFAWGSGERPQLFSHLRSPYSGVARREVDWVEGKLRGRGVRTAERTLEVTTELRAGKPMATVAVVQEEGRPTAIVRTLIDVMVRSAHGIERVPATSAAQHDLRAREAVVRALDELDELEAGGIVGTRADVLHALERLAVRGAAPGAPGRVAVTDLQRARTRRFDAVFIVGLEQGTLPRRDRPSPFLDEEARKRLDESRGARLQRPDTASRDRYLFITACTRASRRLTLVRQAASEDGSPREPSPFWEAVCAVFEEDDVRRFTTRRALSSITRELEAASTERERLRALATLSTTSPDEAEALALANGWDRRLRRARSAFERSNNITDPRALALLGGREAWSVSELERMGSCSAAWFFERYLRPATIDKSVDRLLRGSVLHVALQRFYQALPSVIPGAERVTEANLEEALGLMRECVGQAIETGVRIDVDELERRELEAGLVRDLEQLLRQAASTPVSFVPRKLEVPFRFELEPGVKVSGKIDRVDGDAMSARGIVIDYKSGRASSATDIERDDLLQIPLYMLVLREQLGLEAMGGVYVPVGGMRKIRGMLRDGDERVPGFVADDYLEPEEFDRVIEDARTTAVTLVKRIKAGDITRDPHGGDCPAWCDLWRMCRRERA
jgi:ATP-dependent helicase/DNAse subunit B